MSWVSLVCLLALSSTALGHYGNAYRARLTPVLDQPTGYQQQRLIVPTIPQVPVDTPMASWSQGDQQPLAPAPISQSYGSSYGAQVKIPLKKVIIQNDQGLVNSYGSARVPQMDMSRGYNFQPQMSDQPLPVVPSPADILCQGQRPETVIPTEGGRRFVVCLDNGKGAEQFCPKGLFFHAESRRCERTLGSLPNPCASQPCLNGGQCMPTDAHSYQCQCPAGFDGKTCELDARICQTQQPCGSTGESRCQSFRLNAALSFVCICQQESAYGLNCQQALPSPCRGTDGPQALGFSDKGFIMCDGERMFVESCPGGTIWDDGNKACVWPDLQGVPLPTFPQQDQGGYGSVKSYSSRPVQLDQSLVSSYSQAPIQLDRTPISSYNQAPIQLDRTPISSYNQAPIQLDRTPISSYNPAPIQLDRTPMSSYTQTPIKFDQKTISSYGSTPIQHDLPQPQSYNERPTTYEQRPMTFDQRPTTYEQRPMTFDQNQFIQRPKPFEPTPVPSSGY